MPRNNGPETKAVLFIYQHRYQRQYYQKLCGSPPFAAVTTKLAFYWTPRLPALFAPRLNHAEIAAISGYQQHKRQQRGQKPLRALLGRRAVWDYHCWYRHLKNNRPDVIACWNGNAPSYRAARLAANKLGISCFAFENGPLPNTTTCDARGVNARNSLPRNPAAYRQYSGPLEPAEIAERAHHANTPKAIRLPERYIFAPFQVHEDTQLLAYSPEIPDMQTFFDWLSHAADTLNGTIVVKQHPSCKQRYEFAHPRIVFANGNNTESLIQLSDAVITVNSTVGLEAIALQKPVITLGAAFYNIAGLTLHANTKSDLVKQLEKVDEWQFDEPLRQGFLRYVRQHYLLPGQWREASDEHCNAVATRLLAGQ